MMESIPNLNEARLKIVYPQIADLPYAAQEAVNILRGNLQLSGKFRPLQLPVLVRRRENPLLQFSLQRALLH